MMKIIAHRGVWSKRTKGNSLAAFRNAFERGYGIETDVRDCRGRLVISHNIAEGEPLEFCDFLRLYAESGRGLDLAINIKADGLQGLLGKQLAEYGVENYFVFDMSVPEQVVYSGQGFKVFTRMSDYEPMPILLERACGIWMDEWERPWVDAVRIKEFRTQGKQVAIISPEIHGRDRLPLWGGLARLADDSGILLCTDVPFEAEAYFYGKD